MEFNLNKWYRVYDDMTRDVEYLYITNITNNNYSFYTVTYAETQTEPYIFEIYNNVPYKEFAEYFIISEVKITPTNKKHIIRECFTGWEKAI